MKTRRSFLVTCVGVAVLTAVGVGAQEKAKAAEESKVFTPLKVQVVISEFEGEKKVSSLPYVLSVNAAEAPSRNMTNLRMGLRVPILVQGKEGQFQYHDVGTDIDCWAQLMPEGRFRLWLATKRSSIYSAGLERKPADWPSADQPLAAQPIVRQFSGVLDLLLRDGQTVQTTMATDPVSGRVVKVDVTLNIVK